MGSQLCEPRTRPIKKSDARLHTSFFDDSDLALTVCHT